MIDTPGVYQISAEEYHRDPVTMPSLSSSIAHRLIAHSPLHAWHAHPRLNPAYAPEVSDAFDLGTAAHAFLLGGEDGRFVIIDADDYRKPASRALRDAARLRGHIPILRDRWPTLQAITDAARRQLAAHDQDGPVPLTGGKAEQALIWREGETWCRARIDWLHDGHRWIDDYKTTSVSAHPEQWSRNLFSMGYDVQAAFYRRGVKALYGIDATFRFIVRRAGHSALSVIALAPDALALAEKKVEFALTRWAECLRTNTWPGYPDVTCWAELPPWEEMRWRELAYRSIPNAPADPGGDIGDALFGERT